MRKGSAGARRAAAVIAFSLSLAACRQKQAPKLGEPTGASGKASSEKPTKAVPSSPAVDEELIAASKAAAVAALRSCLSAQNLFHGKDRYGKDDRVYANAKDGKGFPDLYRLPEGEELQLIDAALARATSAASAKDGYWFVDVTSDAAGREYDPVVDCGLCAVPAKYGETGRNTFVIDVTGTVLGKDTGGEPVTAHPGVEAEGWRVAGME
jgi:hypothetical protein